MISNFAFLDFDAPDLIIILAIVLLLFGGNRLPELSRGLGDAIREIRKGLQGDIDIDEENKKKEHKPRDGGNTK